MKLGEDRWRFQYKSNWTTIMWGPDRGGGGGPKALLCHFIFPCTALQEQSGHVRQLIAIWPGSTKSQMKQERGSCKSHITKSLLKAQEHCSAMTSYLVACLQSRLRQEAVIAISRLCHPGDDGTTEVRGKTRFFFFFMFGYILSPKDMWIHCDYAPGCFSKLMKRDYKATGITFVWMWTLTMMKLL